MRLAGPPPARRALFDERIGETILAQTLDTEEAVEPALAETYRQIAESSGYISNLMATIAHSPDGLHGYATLDRYCRHGMDLTPRQRELAILVALRDVHYGWSHHAPLAHALGVSGEDIQLIREGRTPRDLDLAERAVCDYAFEITACRTVPPRVQETVLRHFSPRQIVDLALLTSFHVATAALAIALDVQLEPPETLQAELQWETRSPAGGAVADAAPAVGSADPGADPRADPRAAYPGLPRTP